MSVRTFTNQQDFLRFVGNQNIPQRQDSTKQQLADVQSLMIHLNQNLQTLNKFEPFNSQGVVPFPDIFDSVILNFNIENEKGFLYAVSSLVGCYDAADLFR